LPSGAEDPEMAYIQMTHKREMQEAFREALASLTSKERNLLRYYFLDGMTVEKIGALYGVHHATAARWVQRARENLCAQTRVFACKRISLSEEGFERILGLIESQIQVQLAMEPV
jgi:RNA polymerase sigma-70 factor, ECF subfamily